MRKQLAKGVGLTSEASSGDTHVDEAVIMADYALDKLDPTQRVFADRVLAWGRDLASAYNHNASVRSHKKKKKKGKSQKLKPVPLLRTYLGGSAGSGKSTTLRTVLQHLRLLFQKEGVSATVELIANTGVAAFNIGFGAKTACSAFNFFPMRNFRRS